SLSNLASRKSQSEKIFLIRFILLCVFNFLHRINARKKKARQTHIVVSEYYRSSCQISLLIHLATSRGFKD
ncbi:hypothetical protein BY996DRAFT_7396278, partial [Phakopsora pachyrhizi]